MIIYPAIDIKNGECVRLTQGRFQDITVYGKDPCEIAKKWESSGADFIHVVDLDGALDGKWTNGDAIKKICKEVGAKVQTGGGVRCLDDIKMRLDSGVYRVIIGTAAVKNPDLVKEAIETFGSEHIAVGIDAKDGFVATHGWEKISEKTAVEFAKEMESLGVKTIIYTDIATDGMLTGPNKEAMKVMADAVNIDIIASGGIGSEEDIFSLSDTGASGVIVGRALYTDRVDLKSVLKKVK